MIRSNEMYSQPKSIKLFQQHFKTTSVPSTSNDDCENRNDTRNFENKTIQTDSTNLRSSSSKKESSSNASDQRDTEMIDIEARDSRRKSKIYQGLLFIERMRNSKEQSEYFITYRGFWNDCQESTEISVDCIFNYLKVNCVQNLY